MAKESESTSSFILRHDLDPASAMAAQKSLLEAVGACEDEVFSIEVDGDDATQVSLQILFAGMREIRERGMSCEMGITASEYMDRSVATEMRSDK